MNLTITHNYSGLCLSGCNAPPFIQRSMKTNSALTLAGLLCLGLGSVESFSGSFSLANLSFTLSFFFPPIHKVKTETTLAYEQLY